jgi:Concanavalin A-like lectin/glucanases superfamily/VanZ like family
MGDFLKLFAHFVAFCVLGCLIVSAHEKSLRATGFGRFVVLAIVFCATLELAQFFQLSRHARVVDFLLNSAGVIFGARTAAYWQPLRRIHLILQKRADRHSAGLRVGVFMTAASLWCFAGLRPLMGSLRMDWNVSYPLVIANETDGSRSWLGEIRYIGIYGRALDPHEVSSAVLCRRGSSASGLLVGYDFTKSNASEVSPEGSLRSPDLVIQIPPGSVSWEESRGIVLGEAAILASRGPAARLTNAISSSGAFSVEAWVRPAAQTQTGPARIVGISDGIRRRNFTLGQEDTTGVLRVRNATNGPNGAEQQLEVRDAIQSSLQHLVSVYDHGVSMLYRNGSLLRPVLDLREPSFILGFGPGFPAHATAGILLALLIALPVHSMLPFIRAGRLRHLAAVLTAAVIGGLPYALSCLVVGGPWRNEFFLWMGAGILAAYPLSYVYVSGEAEMLKSGNFESVKA